MLIYYSKAKPFRESFTEEWLALLAPFVFSALFNEVKTIKVICGQQFCVRRLLQHEL